MKKFLFALCIITALTSCNNEPKIVYVTKPNPDTMLLKAEMKGAVWTGVLNAILRNANDTSRKGKDSVLMAVQFISANIGDSTRNPIFKK